MKRGEVWIANLYPTRGREMGKIRPVLIMQANELTDAGVATVAVIPITSQRWPSTLALRVEIPARGRLARDGYLMIEKLRALDRERFGEGPLTTLTGDEMARVERSLLVVLGIYR